MCRQSPSPLFGKASTATLGRPSQVCFGLNQTSQCNLKQFPLPFCAFFSDGRPCSPVQLLQLLVWLITPGDLQINPPICPRGYTINSRCHSNLATVGRDVQIIEALEDQPVHEATREGRSRLFRRVRLNYFLMSFLVRPFFLPSLSHKKLIASALPITRNLLFNLVMILPLPIPEVMLFINTLTYSLTCAIMGRFIISIRELYHRDLRDRWQGIDTGFGVFSQAIDFVDVNLEQGETVDDVADDSRMIRLEAVGDCVHQV